MTRPLRVVPLLLIPLVLIGIGTYLAWPSPALVCWNGYVGGPTPERVCENGEVQQLREGRWWYVGPVTPRAVVPAR